MYTLKLEKNIYINIQVLINDVAKVIVIGFFTTHIDSDFFINFSFSSAPPLCFCRPVQVRILTPARNGAVSTFRQIVRNI